MPRLPADAVGRHPSAWSASSACRWCAAGREFEALTPEGELILGWAQPALADLESLQQEVDRLRGGLEGTLRIGAIPTSLPLSPHVTARFRERHPRMRVRLISMSSREIAHGLEHGGDSTRASPTSTTSRSRTWTASRCGASATCSSRPAGRAVRRRRHLGRGRGAPAVPADRRTCSTAGSSTPPSRRGRDPGAGGRDQLRLDARRPRALGAPGITAHTWLDANPLPADLRAIPLVDPVVEHTIGLVTARDERTPVVRELMALFEPLELDERLRLPVTLGPVVT